MTAESPAALASNPPSTLFEKIWNAHVIEQGSADDALLHVDQNFLHEGAFLAFAALRKEGRTVRRPKQQFAVADHYVPTLGRDAGIAGVTDPEVRGLIDLLEQNAAWGGIDFAGIDDPRQGIVHVIGPELGLTHPGMVITCGDSHTSTHGAFGAFAFGMGASQVKQVLATQCLWQRKPRLLRITIDGTLAPGLSGKDVILAVIAQIGAAGATGHVIEYAGSTIRSMSMENRLTVCNMSIEAGARAGMIRADDTTFDYLHGRPFAPKQQHWDAAVAYWRTLKTDEGATFDREVRVDAGTLVPMVTWGTSPGQGLPITGRVPDPATLSGDARRAVESALSYMGLKPGQAMDGLPVDRVFIGSCTNSRLDDIRAAAAVVRGRKAKIPAFVSPGSTQIKREAEAEGLDRVFIEAGIEWRASGCSMCVGTNGDLLKPGERSASTSNRNFEGRQGRGARTHLVSPAMAAAAAVTGTLTDVRRLLAAG
ncbi:MAG: 3-isopropylmalate dehydratase large subunit [Burkholderiales bacterium]|nr:3-isopropylmalate dehydratase large subunit [Burkholderiales bacterium]